MKVRCPHCRRINAMTRFKRSTSHPEVLLAICICGKTLKLPEARLKAGTDASIENMLKDLGIKVKV